jgi:hypothetical protein
MSATLTLPARAKAASQSATLGPLYDRVSRVIPPMEWPAFAPDIDAILRLKPERRHPRP